MIEEEFKIMRTKELTFGDGALEVTIRLANGMTDYEVKCGDIIETLNSIDDIMAFVRLHPTNSKPSEVKIVTRDMVDRMKRSIGMPPISLIAVDLKTNEPVVNFCILATASASTNNPCAKDRLVKAIAGKRATETLSYTGFKLVPGLSDTEFAEVTVMFDDSDEFAKEFDFINVDNVNGTKLKEFIEVYL